MTDADKLKLSDEIAKAAIKQHTVGTVFVDGVPITLSKTVEGEDGYFAGPVRGSQLLYSNPAHALYAYRKMLAAERDAKDAPRLREALEKIRDRCAKELANHEKPGCHWAAQIATDALKGAS